MFDSINDIAQKIRCDENRRLEKIGVEKLEEYIDSLETFGYFYSDETIFLKKLLNKPLERQWEAFEDVTELELIHTIKVLYSIVIAVLLRPYMMEVVDEQFEETKDGCKITITRRVKQ